MATTRRPSPVVPILLFAAVCAAATFGALTALHLPFTWHYAAVIIYLAGITLVLHLWQEGALITDPKGFVNRFMLGLVLKMLLSLVLIVAVLFLLPREIALPLALTFAVLYLAFLAFSTLRLMARSRNPQ
ncbi:MAG TPA: hypothetical protein VHL57_07550 [Flavobacteriales bacterium]|jgi:hypothetical protein|nr:hypothetical protein [Flavobacteriales bacterium]